MESNEVKLSISEENKDKILDNLKKINLENKISENLKRIGLKSKRSNLEEIMNNLEYAPYLKEEIAKIKGEIYRLKEKKEELTESYIKHLESYIEFLEDECGTRSREADNMLKNNSKKLRKIYEKKLEKHLVDMQKASSGFKLASYNANNFQRGLQQSEYERAKKEEESVKARLKKLENTEKKLGAKKTNTIGCFFRIFRQSSGSRKEVVDSAEMGILDESTTKGDFGNETIEELTNNIDKLERKISGLQKEEDKLILKENIRVNKKILLQHQLVRCENELSDCSKQIQDSLLEGKKLTKKISKRSPGIKNIVPNDEKKKYETYVVNELINNSQLCTESEKKDEQENYEEIIEQLKIFGLLNCYAIIHSLGYNNRKLGKDINFWRKSIYMLVSLCNSDIAVKDFSEALYYESELEYQDKQKLERELLKLEEEYRARKNTLELESDVVEEARSSMQEELEEASIAKVVVHSSEKSEKARADRKVDKFIEAATPSDQQRQHEEQIAVEEEKHIVEVHMTAAGDVSLEKRASVSSTTESLGTSP